MDYYVVMLLDPNSNVIRQTFELPVMMIRILVVPNLNAVH